MLLLCTTGLGEDLVRRAVASTHSQDDDLYTFLYWVHEPRGKATPSSAAAALDLFEMGKEVWATPDRRGLMLTQLRSPWVRPLNVLF
jgi:hypothetical protein